MQVQDINWQQWKPDDIATLLFVTEGNNILLIRKKRGLGAGKINGPGGKLEPGETIEQCAIRELKEEVGLTANNIKWCGENLFQFADDYRMHVHVFKTDQYEGSPIETDEAIPIWYSKELMPFEEMWEDDYLWVPHMLSDTIFMGKYLFDGDKMLDFLIEINPDEQL